MKFKYWARTGGGKVQTGAIDASSKEAAVDLLKSNGLFVTGLEKSESGPIWSRQIKLFERISAMDLVMFSRQLSVMFTSGVSLSESLTSIANQTKKAKFKDNVLKLAQKVEGGTSFSKSLSLFPEMFSNFYVAVIKAGEVSGTMGKSLVYLADHLEKEYNFRSKVKGAMIYPSLVIVSVIGVFILMTVFIMPQLVQILEGSDVEPPTITKIAIGISNFMQNFWVLLVGLMVGLVFGIRFYSKTEEGKRIFDSFYLKIPWVGSFLKKIYLTQFSENLSTLIAGGLPIAQALEVSGKIVGNDVYQRVILEARDKVVKGESITAVFSGYPNIFSNLFCQMILVGEKTGHLDKTLTTVASFYSAEINRVTENLVNILEPVLIVVLGLMVGGLMGAVIIPLYQISSSAI